MRKNELVLAYHGLSHILLLLLLCAFPAQVVFQGAEDAAGQVLLALSILGAGQAFFSLKPGRSIGALLPFFLADAFVAMLLVRSTGSSSSPFLVLFPLISLAGALVFEMTFAAVLVASTLVTMIASVGFGIAILGNAGAILLTGVLGIYLARALSDQGRALRQSEDARRRLESLQKAILANIPSGLISIDIEGCVIQVNGVALKILGRQEQHVLRAHVRELMPDLADKVSSLSTLVPVVRSNEMERATLSYQRPDGRRLQLGYSVARLSDPENGRVLGTLLVFQDLTSVLELEQSLRDSEKLAAVGKLAAGIAHEIRNPLAGISGSAQLLTEARGLNDEDQRLLKIIQRESARLDALIGEFLEYVRPLKLELEAVKLVHVAEQVIENLKVSPRWTQLQCELALTLAPGVGRDLSIEGEGKKITQVLMNLLLNAGQAGAKRVELRIEQDGHVQVLDDGAGISAEHQKRLFEPFFTTKEQGTGLGLAISYKALEAMGARIKVQSPLPAFAPSGGTMFHISFRKAA